MVRSATSSFSDSMTVENAWPGACALPHVSSGAAGAIGSPYTGTLSAPPAGMGTVAMLRSPPSLTMVSCATTAVACGLNRLNAVRKKSFAAPSAK